MKRREFITLLGGAAAAWPLAARAQQPAMRRIGVLMSGRRTIRKDKRAWRRFVQGLQQLGWIEGRNLAIEYRWAAGRCRRCRRSRRNWSRCAGRHPWPIGTTALAPLQQATRTVPIVFAHVADPVGAGLVASLARPGGNVTGFTCSNTA